LADGKNMSMISMSRIGYPSDTSRAQFELICPLLEQARKCTKPRTVDLYEQWCAVLYVLCTGCRWRALPRNFSKWSTVYSYFAKWNEPRDGGSLLEQALKNLTWCGPRETGAERMQHILDCGRSEREEHRHSDAQGL